MKKILVFLFSVFLAGVASANRNHLLPKQYLVDSYYANEGHGCYDNMQCLNMRKYVFEYSDNVKKAYCITSDTTITTFDKEGRFISKYSRFEPEYNEWIYEENPSNHYITTSRKNQYRLFRYNERDDKGFVRFQFGVDDTTFVMGYTTDNKVLYVKNLMDGILDTFVYQPDGTCKKLAYIKSEDGKSMVQTSLKTFDKHGFLTGEYLVENGKLVATESEIATNNVYTYYKDGSVKSRENSKDYTEYNQAGEIIKHDFYNYPDKKVVERETYTYNSNNQLVEFKRIDSKSGKIKDQTIYTYKKGVKFREENYKNGELISYTNYDKYGNPLEVWRKGDKTTGRFEYEYF